MWDCSDTGSLAVSFDGQKYWASGKETSGCW
jgi:hypothetical protein